MCCFVLFLRWDLTMQARLPMNSPSSCLSLPRWGYRHVPPHSSLNIPLIEHHMRRSVFKYFLQICAVVFYSLNNVSWKNKSFWCRRRSHWPPFQAVSILILYDHLPSEESVSSSEAKASFPTLIFLVLKQYLALRRHWSYSSYGKIIAPGYYGKGLCTQALNLQAWAM